jgi:outer membrane protein TolC
MKKMLLVLLSVVSIAGRAQETNSNLTITIQQAIDLGLKNRYDVQSHKYNIAIADNKINQSKKEWIPDISGSGNMRYSPQIQGTYIPGGFLPGYSAEIVSLGAHSTSIYGLDLNQNIFKPAIITDVKIAKNNLELEKEKNKQDESNIKEQILLAYLNAILRELQLSIARDDEQRYKEYAEIAEGQMKLGTVVENDYLVSKLNYENAKVETLKAKQNYDLALDNIKYQLNIPVEAQLTLSDNINSLGLLSSQLSAKGDATSRTEIKQLLLQQEGNKLLITKSKQNALPSVSLYGNYSQQYLSNNFDYSLRQWWSPFNYVGLKVSVPITANFKNSNTIQEHQFRLLQSDLDLKQKTADINYEIQKVSTELSNAMQNMQATKNNYELSKVIYENQKQQYNLGSLLYSNLLDTDKSLKTTEQNYTRSVYDYLVANVNYQKTIGNY